MKIEQRVAAVKRELCSEGIAKSERTNFGGKYKYRGIDSTMAIVSSLHAQYGVNFSIDRIEHFSVQSQGNNTHITCLFVMRFSSSDNKSDYVEHVCIGEGFDQGDKASGKAHSYAYKNGMFSFYEIPVEGQNVDAYDPRIDNENDSDQKPKSIPMPDKVKDVVKAEKESPGKEVKDFREKQKEATKEAEEGIKKEAEHLQLSEKEKATGILRNASLAVAEFIDTDKLDLEYGKGARKNLVDVLNKYRKVLDLNPTVDEAIRGVLSRSKDKIAQMESSKSATKIAEMAKKNSEALG